MEDSDSDNHRLEIDKGPHRQSHGFHEVLQMLSSKIKVALGFGSQYESLKFEDQSEALGYAGKKPLFGNGGNNVSSEDGRKNEALENIAIALNSEEDTSAFLGIVAKQAKKSVHADLVSVALVDFTSGISIGPVSGISTEAYLSLKLPLQGGLCGVDYREEQARMIPMDHDSSLPNCPALEMLVSQGMQSGISAPLQSRGKHLGMLQAFTTRTHGFGKEDMMRLEKIANIASTRIHLDEISQDYWKIKGEIDAIAGVKLKLLKEMNEELRKKTRLLSDMFDNAPYGIYKITPQGRFIEANPECARILGYDNPEDLISTITDAGKQLYMQPDGRKEFLRAFLEKGIIKDHETEFCKKDGSRVWVSLTAKIRHGDPQDTVCYEGMIRDISAKKQIEQALSESERRFREMADNVPLMMFETDRNGKLTYVNQAAYHIFKKTREEFDDGINALSLIHPQDLPLAMQNLEAKLQGREIQPGQYRLSRPDGTYFHGEIRSSVIRNDDEIIGIRGIIIDLTDQKELMTKEEQLINAEKQQVISLLTREITHNFNNVLTPIMIICQRGMKKSSDDPKMYGLFEGIYQAAERCADFIKHMQDFSRKQALTDIAGFDIKEEIVGYLGFLDSASKNKIVRDLTGEKLHTHGSKAHLHQIFSNLYTNAQHAINDNKDGMIKISLSRRNHEDDHQDYGLLLGQYDDKPDGKDYAEIRVTDDGCGIKRDDLSKIIERNFTTKGNKGNGIGLASVYRLVKGWGGRLFVRSEPGIGTEFTVLLPIYEEPKEKDSHIHNSSTKDYCPTKDDGTIRYSALQKKNLSLESVTKTAEEGSDRQDMPLVTDLRKIIVVDDEQSINKTIRRLLEKKGYKVASYVSAKEAYAAFCQDPESYSLMITDQDLNGERGIDLAREIKKIGHVPCILLTGYIDDRVRKEADELGMTVMSKPIRDMTTFYEQVRNKIGNSPTGYNS